MSFVILCLLVILLPAPAHAQDARGSIERRDGLPSDGVTALASDGETLWIGTLRGLAQWQEGQATTVEFPLEEHHALALHNGETGLWVGTADGIARFADGAWQTWQVGDDGLRSDWGTSFTEHQGTLYVGTYGGSVQRWTDDQWQSVGANPPLQITTLTSNGPTLWAGTPRGLWSWNGSTWSQADLAAENPPINRLALTENALWAGTEAGLFRQPLSPPSSAWEPVPALENADVLALAATPAGLAAATLDGLALVNEDGTLSESSLPNVDSAYLSSLLYAGERLFVGTLGRGVRWVGAPLETRQLEPDKPRVVLLHGLGDSDQIANSNFRFLAQWLRRDGYSVTMAPYDASAPLLENVATLRRVVARAREATDQPQVILIAHSFGGLVGRAFLASGTDAVAGLVTLGTPHAGARMAYDFIVPDLSTSDSPATRELLPEHAALLAPFQEQGHVPQLHVGGDILPQNGLAEGFPPNDGRITAASAVAAPGATRLEPLAHGWTLEIMGGNIPSFLWPDDLYLTTLRPWIQSVTAGAAWQDRAESPPLPDPGFTRRVGFEQTIQPGGTEIIPLFITESATTWFLEGEGVTMDLLAPDGTLYRHDRVLVGESVAHLPSRDNAYLPLDLWTTEGLPGQWRALLANTSNGPITATLSLIEPDGPTLQVTVEEQWAEPGTPVTIRVRAETGQTVTATLGDQQARLQEAASRDYRGELPAPPEPGYHSLLVSDAQRERWAVVGVRSDNWTVQGAEATQTENTVRLRLSVQGEGRLALGMRLLRGETVVATRLLGPFTFPASGTHTLT
ncbi:MAG TPA: alpha/beta fold hydrolase, partial [Ardenticatenaceae bacterium]